MKKVKFTVDGYEGDFVCDADEVKSYRTAKQLIKAQEDAGLAFDVMERIFLGRDEEYVDRVGGEVDDISKLLAAAVEACGAKNSSASPAPSKRSAAK